MLLAWKKKQAKPAAAAVFAKSVRKCTYYILGAYNTDGKVTMDLVHIKTDSNKN